MLAVLFFLTSKRRIAEDVGALFVRQDCVPVQPERVGANNCRRLLQRQTVNRLTENFGDLQVHLVVHQPERDFGNAHRPFGVFDAMELIHVNDGKELLAARPGGVSRTTSISSARSSR